MPNRGSEPAGRPPGSEGQAAPPSLPLEPAEQGHPRTLLITDTCEPPWDCAGYCPRWTVRGIGWMNALRALVMVGAFALVAAACSSDAAHPPPTAATEPTGVPTAAAAPGGDGPGHGTPTVVSVGDSYISGEGGRWAGNVSELLSGWSKIDALGPTAYFDNADHSAETIANCHRSTSAAIHIGAVNGPNGPNVHSINLACSGATTQTADPDNTEDFKPGLDAYGDADGNLVTDEPTAAGAHISQAVALRKAAGTHNVTMVVVSIGGNNFHFSDTIKACVKDYVLSTRLAKNYCNDDPVAANFDAAHAAERQSEISRALQNVHDAMTGAGYTDATWTLVVETPPLPIPVGSAFRYPETGITIPRLRVGGCGFWNADADWAGTSVLPVVSSTIKAAAARLPYPNVRVLDLSAAFSGHRLCENTVGTLDEQELASWQSAGAVDRTEWIAPIRGFVTADNLLPGVPYQMQESFHPNYWGQLALRSCLRQAYNNGSVRGGTCSVGGTGLTDHGEPVMQLAPS